MIHNIDQHIKVANDAIEWANEYKKESFPFEQFKDYRRQLNKIKKAIQVNSSAAAYGESQVGKSYLMSSLLSSPEHPFVIVNNGKEYSFIYDLNPSGGNTTNIESTGIITRFTIRNDHKFPDGFVKVLNLSVIDIILLLTDSYYNDIKINPETSLTYDAINRELESMNGLWGNRNSKQDIIAEDDIKDIIEYTKNIIGNNAAAVYQSNFAKIIAPVIQYIPYDKWVSIFSLLWNKNAEISRLFETLINAYKDLDFRQEILVPFEAVLRSKGTLLKISWLDTVCGLQVDTKDDVVTTDIYTPIGELLVSNFPKGMLSALIAELTFVLPSEIADERKFLKKMDLLDFPGARSRERYKEKEITKVLPKMLRRGKVAYLFNKYSRSLQIGSVLFCHHCHQKSEPSLGDTIDLWISENIGVTPKERSKLLQNTKGKSPLFLVATKFNIDMERTRLDFPLNLETLDKHWDRFDTVIPEIIKPARWLDEWAEDFTGSTLPFRSIYPLRDFYWSAQKLFDGYTDSTVKSEEISVHHHDDFPDYLDRLKESFLKNPFVKSHFDDPQQTWEEVATLNNDGSKAIIRDLDILSDVIDNARRQKFKSELESIRNEMLKTLAVYFDPEDIEGKNKKVRQLARDIRLTLTREIAKNPSLFGQIIDKLMINPEKLRNIAYEIIVCHTDAPKDFTEISFIRAQAGIDLSLPREENIKRLLDYYMCDTEEELQTYLKEENLDNEGALGLEDILAQKEYTLSTIGDVIAKHILENWIEHLNNVAMKLTELPHADEVVFMFITLAKKLDIFSHLSKKINRYSDIFSENERPNAIGDFASLTLNNFISNVGQQYMHEDLIDQLKEKASVCNLSLDFNVAGWERSRRSQSLMDTLRVLDESARIINQGTINKEVLAQLPFWANYEKWENRVIIGLVFSSDISKCDPECNRKIKDLIDRVKPLYT